MAGENGFDFRLTAREIALEHLPPMGTGIRNEENLVLDGIALYQAVYDALHDAWRNGREIGEQIEKREQKEALEGEFEAGRQQAMDSVDEWYRPPGR